MNKTYTKQQLSKIAELFGEDLTINLRLRFIDGLITPERKVLCDRGNKLIDELNELGCLDQDQDLIFDLSWKVFPVDQYLGYDKKVLGCLDIE
jgi:hypothetical protein